MKILKEFKEFAVKGNMIDMAIGLIIAKGFNSVVSSLVNDVIMPLMSPITGNMDISELSFVIYEEVRDAETGKVIQDLVSVNYGEFIQLLVDFFIIAWVAFFVVKLLNRYKRKADDAKDKTVTTPKDIELLSEIRDLLKEKQKDK